MAKQKKKLRVLLVTARYFPYMGGIETHNYEVARRLVQRGVDVTVLTSDPGGQLATKEEIDGVKVHRVHAYPAQRDYYFAPGIRNAIQQGDWDIMHCQGVHTFVPPIAMLAAQQKKLPYVVTFHTGGHSARWRNAIRGLQFALLRPLLIKAKRYVGVSRYETEFFRDRLRLPGDRFVIIPNGSDLPAGVVPAPIDESVTLIVSVGRLERYKGHHRVIEALPKVREQCPTAQLLILGTGPYEAALHQLTRELNVANAVDIRMIPASDRPAMAATLARANLVTLLSEAESNPVAVMEAVALRRPVLVANNSGFQELAERGLVHAIPLASSTDQVAAEILHQLHEPLIPTGFELPTWEGCTDQLLDVYHTVL
ncbi:MAG: glycosyltransferase family 4 protein [Caldilineaceae bacterium]